MRTLYARAALGAMAPLAPHARHPEAANMEGLFDFVGDAAKAVGKAVGGAAKVVSDAVETVDKAYVKATPQWLRKGLGAAVAPVKLGWDAADNIAHGQRIDRALLDAGRNQVEIFKTAAPIAQLGLSFIPGVGQGVSAAIGAGLALADGKPITDALFAAVKSALPGGPIVQQAVDLGARAAVDLASGKSLDAIALDAVRRNLPGGEAARIAFDTGLALAQGKKLQDAGMAAAAHFVPNTPLAQGAFEMTRRALAGHPLEGSTQTAMRRIAAQKPAAPQQRRTAAPVHRLMPAMRRPPMPTHASRAVGGAVGSAPAHEGSHVVPLAIGAAALVAAGGGAWWWLRKERVQ